MGAGSTAAIPFFYILNAAKISHKLDFSKSRQWELSEALHSLTFLSSEKTSVGITIPSKQIPTPPLVSTEHKP